MCKHSVQYLDADIISYQGYFLNTNFLNKTPEKSRNKNTFLTCLSLNLSKISVHNLYLCKKVCAIEAAVLRYSEKKKKKILRKI